MPRARGTTLTFFFFSFLPRERNNLYPVFMKELQNAWKWSAAMDLKRTDIKQQNKMLTDLLFFPNMSTMKDVNKKENECV